MQERVQTHRETKKDHRWNKIGWWFYLAKCWKCQNVKYTAVNTSTSVDPSCPQYLLLISQILSATQ